MERSKLKDSMGRPLTQALFLEIGYKTEFAQYTLKDEDYEYEGKVYPSIRKLYIEAGDPTEYSFAVEHFLGWDHWMRISSNKVIEKEVIKWRDELEVKLRSEGVMNMRAAAESGNANAAKWVADRGWDKRAAGRPSKEEVARETKVQARMKDEFMADVVRIS